MIYRISSERVTNSLFKALRSLYNVQIIAGESLDNLIRDEHGV